MRPYPGQAPGPDLRGPPPQPRRASPRDHHAVMGPYPGAGAQGLPQPPPPSHAQGAPGQPQRISNPNYTGSGPSAALAHAQNGMNSSGPSPLPPFGRGSPRSDVRPILDNRINSPKSAYPHQQSCSHHPDISNPGGIEGGAPPPASALAAAEAAAAQRIDERPASVGPKRMREWEEEQSIKKPASDENRARLEDSRHRRPSTPPRETFRRSSSEARRNEDARRLEDQRRAEDQRCADEQRRAEDHRRANENYHPSEAAHHPPPHALPQGHLPPMQQGAANHDIPPPPPPASAAKEYPAEERLPSGPIPEPERAARKMDVDEDYDDEGDEDKKGGIVSATGSGPSSTSEDKVMSPNGVNGHAANGAMTNGVAKVETPA